VRTLARSDVRIGRSGSDRVLTLSGNRITSVQLVIRQLRLHNRNVADEVERHFEEAGADWRSRGLSPEDARTVRRLVLQRNNTGIIVPKLIVRLEKRQPI
jgi:hypothetical protein